MKKLLILAVFLLAPLSMSAQGVALILPSVSVNAQQLTKPSDQFNSDYRAGFSVGGGVRLNFGKWLLQPEAMFSRKGGNFSGAFTGIFDGDINSYYLDVPILAGYKLFDQGLLVVRLHAGPMASIFLTGDGDDDVYNRTTWGMQVGAGIDVWKMTFDFRYERGFTDAFTGGGGLDDSQQQLFRFQFGFKLLDANG